MADMLLISILLTPTAFIVGMLFGYMAGEEREKLRQRRRSMVESKRTG